MDPLGGLVGEDSVSPILHSLHSIYGVYGEPPGPIGRLHTADNSSRKLSGKKKKGREMPAANKSAGASK